MLTIKFDQQPATSQATARRKATQYLRGIVAKAAKGFEHLVGRRVLVWEDSDELEPLMGQVHDLTCDFRDDISVDGTGQMTRVIANVMVEKTYTLEEAIAIQSELMLAQDKNLSTRGVRTIARPTTAQPTSETPAEAAANAALPEESVLAPEEAPI